MKRFFKNRRTYKYYDKILDFLSVRGVGNFVEFSSVFNHLYGRDFKADKEYCEKSENGLDILYTNDISKPVSVYTNSFRGSNNQLTETLNFLQNEGLIEFDQAQEFIKLTPKGDTISFKSDYYSKIIDKYLNRTNLIIAIITGGIIVLIINWDSIKSFFSS